MITLVVCLAAGVLVIRSPRGFIAVLCALVLGLCFGGCGWGIAAAVWPSLVTPEAFACSVAMATAAFAAWALRD